VPGYLSQGQFKAQNGDQLAQLGTGRFANADPFCSVLKPFSNVPTCVSRYLKRVDCLFARQARMDWGHPAIVFPLGASKGLLFAICNWNDQSLSSFRP
jgi:hypothetical protein